MSPANRRPRRGADPARRARLTVVPTEPEPTEPERCACPDCPGEADPARMVEDLVASMAVLVDADDPLDAELAGAALAALMATVGGDAAPVLARELVPRVEANPSGTALALLLAIGSTRPGAELAEAASAAAGRLAAHGIPVPRWAGELAEPVRVGDCLRLHHPDEPMSVLVGSFGRAGRGHAVLVFADRDDCGAAADILLLDADDLPDVVDDLRGQAGAEGLKIETQVLHPAEFRWYVEDALDSRAAHDEEELDDPFDAGDGDGPPYQVVAQLVRARLAALPEPRRPADARAHTHSDARAATAAVKELARLLDADQATFGGPRFATAEPRRLPAKRKESSGPAPIYQIKVALLGAKPPIWRRLQVPGDLSLAGLHDVIQAAFGWQDSHLHIFATPYGEFGRADRELGNWVGGPVTLEQVAPRALDKLRYTYDFGDDWVHEIVVEKVLDREPELAYPRCTGGRRAAPPDDCGGLWGYQELIEALADTRHPAHGDRLTWMGLSDPSEFDPAAFDPREVDEALARLR